MMWTVACSQCSTCTASVSLLSFTIGSGGCTPSRRWRVWLFVQDPKHQWTLSTGAALANSMNKAAIRLAAHPPTAWGRRIALRNGPCVAAIWCESHVWVLLRGRLAARKAYFNRLQRIMTKPIANKSYGLIRSHLMPFLTIRLNRRKSCLLQRCHFSLYLSQVYQY